MRNQLIASALLTNTHLQSKIKSKKSIEEMTTFKPFNILETNWQPINSLKSKTDQYANEYNKVKITNYLETASAMNSENYTSGTLSHRRMKESQPGSYIRV